MKIGILQTGAVPDQLSGKFGQYIDLFSQLLAAFDLELTNYDVENLKFPASVDSQEGWLITGSRHGAYEKHAFIPPLETFIREAYARDIPIAGICFGHQIMAQALGGKVEKFSSGWGLGTISYQTESGSTLSLNAMHQDQVVEKPEDATIVLSNDFCANAGLAYKGKALSFQPHPEFDEPFLRALIEYKSGRGLPETKANEALETLVLENDSSQLAKQIAEFFFKTRID